MCIDTLVNNSCIPILVILLCSSFASFSCVIISGIPPFLPHLLPFTLYLYLSFSLSLTLSYLSVYHISFFSLSLSLTIFLSLTFFLSLSLTFFLSLSHTSSLSLSLLHHCLSLLSFFLSGVSNGRFRPFLKLLVGCKKVFLFWQALKIHNAQYINIFT